MKTINHSQKGHQIHLRSPQKKKQEKHIIFFVKVWETKIRRTKENICGQKTPSNLKGCLRTNAWPICWIFDTCFDFVSSTEIKGVHFGTFHQAGWGDQVTNCSNYFEINWNLSSQIYCDLPAKACSLQELLTPENIEPFWVKDPYPMGKDLKKNRPGWGDTPD